MQTRILFTCVLLSVFLSFPALAATGTVNPDTRYQTLEGFGAAGAWYEGWLTDHPQRETLYNLIFDGLGLDIYRVRNTYDYDSDYMSRTQTIVTEGLQRNPNLKILISAWSPPPYLKSTGDLNGDDGTLIGGLGNYNYTGYAQWWADSITAWSSYNVDADYISIQNEPDWNGNDRCLFDPTENSSHAGYDQAFEAVWQELNSRFGSSMPKMVGPETISFTGAGAYINAMIDQSHAYGYAHHLYGPSSADDPDGYISGMTTFAANYGYKPLFETEFSKLEEPGAIYFSDAMNLAMLMHNALAVEGVVAYLYWDLYWAEPGCLISFPGYGIDDYTINPVYYAFKHYAKFTDPGWQRIYATENSSNLRMSAYISPNQQNMSIVIVNTGTSDESLSLTISNYTVNSGTIYRSTSTQNCANVGSYSGGAMTIPAQSITTVSISGVGDIIPPAAPTGLDAVSLEHAASLDWDDNSETDLDGYNVYRSTTSGSGYSKINTSLLSVSDYVDYDVTAGTTYYYVVTASDIAENESDYSNQDWATPFNTAPSAPQGVSITPGAGTIWLNWNDNTEIDLDGYYVYRSTTSGGGYTRLNSTPLTDSDYVDLDADSGIVYYYVITAVDTYSLESANSAEVSGAISGSGPTIYNFNGITAANANVNAYTCDVDVFPFYDLADNRNTMVEATDLQYTYISADDSDIWLSANPGTGDEMLLWLEMQFYESPQDIDRIDLTFKGSSDGTGNISHGIYVLKAGADWTVNDSWVQVGESMDIPSGVDTAMTRTIISDLSDYIDASGKFVWAVFEIEDSIQMRINYVEAAVYSSDYPPAAPNNLSATAGNGTVLLDWDDNSEFDLAGYNVYRSTTSGSGYSKINPSLVGVSQYTDNTVTNGTTYYYVVTAVDAADNESVQSSEVSAAPQIPSTDIEILGSWTSGTSHNAESGYSRALILIAHSEDDTAITLSSVTYGGQPMTKVIEEVVGTSYRAYVTAFILDEAGIAAATGDTFVPTWSTTPDDAGYSSVFLANVDQADSVGASDGNGSASSTPNPISTEPLATMDGDMVFVAATCGNTSDYTINSGFTEAAEVDMSSSTGSSGYKLATGADETPSVTNSDVNRQVIIGFVVQAAAAGYQTCAEVQAAGLGLVSDLTGDCYVDLEDLDMLAGYWLDSNCGSSNDCEGADFAPTDGDVDFEDFSDFAVDWFECNNPQDANCTINW